MSLLAQVPAVADTLAQNVMDTAAQAAAAVAAPVAQAAPAAEPVVKDLSVWNLTMAGGWLMIPLALLAIVSLYIFFERLFAVNRASKEDAAFMEKIKNFRRARIPPQWITIMIRDSVLRFLAEWASI